MVPCFHFSHVHIVHNSILSFGKLQRRHLTKVKETCCTPFLPTNIRPQSGILIRLFIHFSRISNFRPHPVKIIIKRFQFILSRSRSTARETISRERERETPLYPVHRVYVAAISISTRGERDRLALRREYKNMCLSPQSARLRSDLHEETKTCFRGIPCTPSPFHSHSFSLSPPDPTFVVSFRLF